MSGGRPKKELPEKMPLHQRPSFLGVLPVFRKHAARFEIDFLDVWGGKKGPPALARRAIALELRTTGYGPRVIGWAMGWDIATACRAIKRARAERGDVATITEELGTKPEDVVSEPPPPEVVDTAWIEEDDEDEAGPATDPEPQAADEDANGSPPPKPLPQAHPSPVASGPESVPEAIGLHAPLEHDRHDESVRLGRPATDEDIVGIDPFDEPLFPEEA